MTNPPSEAEQSRVPTDQLPCTDTDRLFFYTEVLIANIPTLIADLSSPKYTFLSFSEKTRTEVKQKSALIQSISRTYNNVLSTRKQLDEKRKKLEAFEVQLLSASPPTFMTSEEALQSQVEASDSAEAIGRKPGSGPTIMVLSEADVAPVREAEVENQKETQALTELTESVSSMEVEFTAAREKCEAMTRHVQSLKSKYEEVSHALKSTQFERRLLSVVREEFCERQAVEKEAVQTLRDMEVECCREELEMIKSSIEAAKAQESSLVSEEHSRKDKHEVELAAYQIAYKEEQAELESLKDDIASLRKLQGDLELLAKQQQYEESNQNSLTRLVKTAFLFSSGKTGRQPLSREQTTEVKEDHAIVTVIAARIAVMNEQRADVGGILTQCKNAYDNDAVSSALEHVHQILQPAVTLDVDAVNA